MKFENIKNKRIEHFVDNGIDKYRKNINITISEMIKVFLDNNGFCVFKNDNSDFIGYIDLADLELITKFVKEIKTIGNKSVKDMVSDDKIKLRKETINSNESLITVLEKLNSTIQNYYPIFKKDVLIGRVSKRILKEKIKDIY